MLMVGHIMLIMLQGVHNGNDPHSGINILYIKNYIFLILFILILVRWIVMFRINVVWKQQLQNFNEGFTLVSTKKPTDVETYHQTAQVR